MKTDSNGNQVWNKGYDLMNLNGYKISIIQTNDGGYAIAGTQNDDFCLFKIKSTNQLEWSKIYGDQYTDTPCALVQLEDGGYALAGTWAPNGTVSTRNTMCLLRTDSSGTVSWTNIYSAKEDPASYTYSNDQAYAMIRTNDGAYALVGSTLFGSETHQDIFFVKTETLEQTPQTTPIPTPATQEPSTTDDTEQTVQPSSDSTQTDQTQAPSNSNTAGASEDNVFSGLNQDGMLIIIAVVFIVVISVIALALVRIKRK